MGSEMCIRDRSRYNPDLYDLYDLYDLAHVAGWEQYDLHDLAHVSWVGSALLYRSCTTPQNPAGEDLDNLDDLSDQPDLSSVGRLKGLNHDFYLLTFSLPSVY